MLFTIPSYFRPYKMFSLIQNVFSIHTVDNIASVAYDFEFYTDAIERFSNPD